MIIGFVGFIGSGKGTLGTILEERGFIKESFAKSVKDAISVIFGWRRDLLEGETEESRVFRETPDPIWSSQLGRTFTPRDALQLMGTESGRNVFHKDIWSYSLFNRIRDRILTNDFVITDVRFPNEIKMIKDHGGEVYHVQRGKLPSYFNKAKEMNNFYKFDVPVEYQTLVTPDWHPVHYSEWAWIGYPLINPKIIVNSGTGIDHLRETLYNMVDNLAE